MDIFIDDEIVNLKLKAMDVEDMIEVIEDYLYQDGKVITEVKINGQKVMDSIGLISGFADKVYLVEVKSKTHVDVVIESLYNMKTYADKYYEILDGIEEELDIQQLHEIMAFIEWSIGVGYSILEVTSIPDIYLDYAEFLENFKNSATEAVEFYKLGDYNRMLDVLDLEVTSYIEAFEFNAEGYLNEILKDEGRKKLLN